MEGDQILELDQLRIQVLLHDPVEFPEVNKKGTFVDIGKEVRQYTNRKYFPLGVDAYLCCSYRPNGRCQVNGSREEKMFA